MLRDQKNTKKQGDVGMGAAIAYFVSQGQPVSIPLTDSQEYDLIVDIDGELKKVQVKTTYHKNKQGWYAVGIKTCGGNQSFNTIKKFDNTKVDFLFCLTEMDDKYFIPSADIDAKQQLILGHKYQQYRV